MFSPHRALGFLILLVAFAVNPGCDTFRDDKIGTRVRNVLTGIQEEAGSTGDKLNFAMLEWDGGQHKTESVNLEGVYDRFIRWCREKDIDRRFASFEVTQVAVQPGVVPTTAIVTVRIEGVAYRMRVAEGRRISWVD